MQAVAQEEGGLQVSPAHSELLAKTGLMDWPAPITVTMEQTVAITANWDPMEPMEGTEPAVVPMGAMAATA